MAKLLNAGPTRAAHRQQDGARSCTRKPDWEGAARRAAQCFRRRCPLIAASCQVASCSRPGRRPARRLSNGRLLVPVEKSQCASAEPRGEIAAGCGDRRGSGRRQVSSRRATISSNAMRFIFFSLWIFLRCVCAMVYAFAYFPVSCGVIAFQPFLLALEARLARPGALQVVLHLDRQPAQAVDLQLDRYRRPGTPTARGGWCRWRGCRPARARGSPEIHSMQRGILFAMSSVL